MKRSPRSGGARTGSVTGPLLPPVAPVLPKTRKRRLLLGAAVLVLVPVLFLARPAAHLALTAWRDADERTPVPAGFLDDASRLNRTAVAAVEPVPAGAADPEAEIAAVLARARREGRRVSIAGARHSMGGHTLYPGGVVLDMRPLNGMRLRGDGQTLTVQAGALWADVIPYLDARGRSVAVMQSNNAFTVGGSVSVNCHGWQTDSPPIAATVESFRLMLADGTVRRCGRTENAELFSLALGGYGLFGVILDVDLRTVPNERLRLERRVMSSDRFPAAFAGAVAGRGDVPMAFGRLNVDPAAFLGEAIVSAFVSDPGPIPALIEPSGREVARAVFRGSEGSDYGKAFRWTAEKRLQPLLVGTTFSRNQLLNADADFFENRSAATTDILHEYFVPRDQAGAIVDALRTVVPRHDGDLLNVTVRSVEADPDTVLRYADGPTTAFVLLFAQARTAAAEKTMTALTRDLIDAALNLGGRYYLPYRLHATPGQFRRAYPRADEFFAAKRRYDPDGLFANRFSAKYGFADP